MSILDLGITSPADLERQLGIAAPIINEILNDTGLAENNFIKLAQAGYSAKEIFEVTDEEMETLFRFGCQSLEAGDLEKARDVFTKLCQLDGLDSRFPFALGGALQLQGSFALAAKMYLLALALDAMRVDAYVRVGECLIAAGEDSEAREVLEIAMSMSGDDDDAVKKQAAALLKIISARATA